MANPIVGEPFPVSPPPVSTPPKPIELLRRKLGFIADACNRALDQLHGEHWGIGQLVYLSTQLDHICEHHGCADEIVSHACVQLGVKRFINEDQDEWRDDDVVSIPAETGGNGGAA